MTKMFCSGTVLSILLVGWALCEGAVFGDDYYKPLPTLGPLTSCPPPTTIQFCESACMADYQCPPSYKCCSTQCGGRICTLPVTASRNNPIKDGKCPRAKSGPWICSDMCSNDGDCRGNMKCCQNRCGAFVCTVPERGYI